MVLNISAFGLKCPSLLANFVLRLSLKTTMASLNIACSNFDHSTWHLNLLLIGLSSEPFVVVIFFLFPGRLNDFCHIFVLNEWKDKKVIEKGVVDGCSIIGRHPR
jgi:hypothetical protein